MRVPTTAGQYRRVKYADDGCDIYACCWCDRTIEIRDNPAYGWNFCPKCGKSWFKQLMCRPNTVPAWAWNRYGPEEHDHPPYWPEYKRPTHEWYFESRYQWGLDDEWREWKYKWTTDFSGMGSWKHALSVLRGLKLSNQPRNDDDFHYEYRVTLRKKNGH